MPGNDTSSKLCCRAHIHWTFLTHCTESKFLLYGLNLGLVVVCTNLHTMLYPYITWAFLTSANPFTEPGGGYFQTCGHKLIKIVAQKILKYTGWYFKVRQWTFFFESAWTTVMAGVCTPVVVKQIRRWERKTCLGQSTAMLSRTQAVFHSLPWMLQLDRRTGHGHSRSPETIWHVTSTGRGLPSKKHRQCHGWEVPGLTLQVSVTSYWSPGPGRKMVLFA